MSGFEHKPGSFSLFKNDRKTQDNHPDYSGPGKDLQGNDIQVAAWLKDGKKGKFMSCKISPPRQQRNTPPSHEEPPPADDSGIPF